jgi:single-stranded-DNA-specific exonuclease
MREYADLVAIGTIADVMPLINENRCFVRAGLEKINSYPRKSIKAFISQNGDKKYTSTDLAFQLCPRINAMGRMGDASRAVEFLLCENEEECASLCIDLSQENANRQAVEKEILEDVNKKIAENPKLASGRVIVIAGEQYHHGVIGIVSAHVLEKYGKPTFIIGIDDDNVARGSARSIDGFNIYDAISACSDDLIQFGGHPLAAGITLDADMIDKFRDDINSYALSNYPSMPAQELVLDCKLSAFYLTTDLVDNLSVLEPYGEGNEPVVFGIYKMTLISITPLSEGKHIRLELEKKGKRIRVVKFGTTPDDFPYQSGDLLNLAVKVSKSPYNGKMYLSVQAVDIRLSSTDDDKYFSEKNKYDLFRATGNGDASLYPTRDVCAYVYKYLKANSGYKYSMDDLYFRLQNRLTYGQLMYTLKAFSQAGLININGTISLNNINQKVSLEDTDILKALKGRLQNG